MKYGIFLLSSLSVFVAAVVVVAVVIITISILWVGSNCFNQADSGSNEHCQWRPANINVLK